jgi:hypothetical protein
MRLYVLHSGRLTLIVSASQYLSCTHLKARPARAREMSPCHDPLFVIFSSKHRHFRNNERQRIFAINTCTLLFFSVTGANQMEYETGNFLVRLF